MEIIHTLSFAAQLSALGVYNKILELEKCETEMNSVVQNMKMNKSINTIY